MGSLSGAYAVESVIEKQRFSLQRTFGAPRELIFAAFTESEHISRWWAPHPYTIPVCRIDLRPGGMWHYCMRSPEGEDHWAKAVFVKVHPPVQVVYDGSFADEDGNTIEGHPAFRVTVSFVEHRSKTIVTVDVEFEFAEGLETAVKMGMVEGMTMALNQLAAQLESNDNSERNDGVWQS